MAKSFWFSVPETSPLSTAVRPHEDVQRGQSLHLKMHPVNGYLGPFLEQAFSDAIAKNFLVIAYGGAAEGAYLAQHEGVDELHITGSERHTISSSGVLPYANAKSG